MMKRILAFAAAGGLILLASTVASTAQTKGGADDDNPTAYTALRLISKSMGREALDRVVEVSGREGMPQPFLWKVILKEGTGSREVDVAGGKITAQRPLDRPPASSSSIHLADLNLDSSGAFDAVDAQARKVKLRYDSLNYVLRVSSETGKPVWTINLLDKDGSEVGVTRLAAHDGTTLSTDGRLASNLSPAGGPSVASSTTTVVHAPVPRETPRPTYQPPAVTHEPAVTSTTIVRRTTVPPVSNTYTSTTTTTQDIPVATLSDHEEDDNGSAPSAAGSEQGGLFTRTGRTLDKTSHTVEHHLRRAGATVQRFFTGHSDIDPENQHDE